MRGDPGQESTRRCIQCGELLAIGDGELCVRCRPRLSPEALAAATLRRQQRDDIITYERAVADLENLIRKLEKKVRRHGYTI
jgi:hypothetical protein